jgi:hypothetical protein
VQPRVEALQELGVELRGRQVAERREDVEPDEVVVPLPRGVLQGGDVEPLLDGLPEGDVGVRVLVLVDLALQPGHALLGLGVGRPGLAEPARLAGQRVGACVDDDAVRAARQLLDVAADAAPARRHGTTVEPVRSTSCSTRLRLWTTRLT